MRQDQPIQHIPVLLEQVLQYLDPKEGDSYLDLTAGYGGHAEQVLERTHNPDDSVLVDRDQNAIAVLEQKFAGTGIKLIQSDFLSASP
jgi:16S rRNA (cytosine1402-N4)-methyltransferase